MPRASRPSRSSPASYGSNAVPEPVQHDRASSPTRAPRGRRGGSRRRDVAARARWREAMSTGPGALLLGEVQLLLVGVDHLVDRDALSSTWSVLTPTTTEPPSSRATSARARDELAGGRGVQAHVALRGVHGVGDAEAPRVDVAAERERRVPVDVGGLARGVVGRGPRHDVRGGVGDAAAQRAGRAWRSRGGVVQRDASSRARRRRGA